MLIWTLADKGFCIEHSVLLEIECDELTRMLSKLSLNRQRAGARHLMTESSVSELAADDRLLAIARRFVGHKAMPFRATLFDKSPSANWPIRWHQDTTLPVAEYVDQPNWGTVVKEGAILYARDPAFLGIVARCGASYSSGRIYD